MTQYNADAIEVLTGLEPVRKRPGMYTDTARPNHLAQEVIDNSVDEALAGFASQIDVVLHADGAITITDNGRGMPVDLHPEQKKPGVEVILSTPTCNRLRSVLTSVRLNSSTFLNMLKSSRYEVGVT